MPSAPPARGCTPRLRQSTSLLAWVDQYLAEREGDLNPESMRKLRQTRAKLAGHFGDTVPLRKLHTQDAANWRQYLKSLNLSEAAIKIHGGNAKTMLAEAVRRKLIEDNPFILLKSGPTASQYRRYIKPEEIDRIIAT